METEVLGAKNKVWKFGNRLPRIRVVGRKHGFDEGIEKSRKN